ncbi:hypothetical protein EDD18DRAFT_1116119 [Armillaria luteobubalina]|uniref:Uncharacterized protein n=1 Tax=Armillaria luteobubalina TaxID=153913 RepID=A0AA39P106_9AGAR|nr:hypothetical protein EDD18DRAFT_1116119 [Armillaria luteobubalina]
MATKYFKCRLSAFASILTISLVGVPVLAKIKAKHILEHLQMAQSEQPTDPSQAINTTALANASGPSKPKQPTAFQCSIAYSKFYAGLESLSQLQEAPPQPCWTSTCINQWVCEAKKLWIHHGAQVDIAPISAKEFQGVEFEFLQLLLDFLDEQIAVAFAEYNELIACAHQYCIKVFPLPVPVNLVPDSTLVPPSRLTSQVTPVPPSSVEASAILAQKKTASTDTMATPFVATTPRPSANPQKVPSVDRLISSPVTVPLKVPSDTSEARPQCPKLTLHGPCPPTATQDLGFHLDPTLPLHPVATKVFADFKARLQSLRLHLSLDLYLDLCQACQLLLLH